MNVSVIRRRVRVEARPAPPPVPIALVPKLTPHERAERIHREVVREFQEAQRRYV